MGYMRHHAIVVTGPYDYSSDHLGEAHAKAEELIPCLVSEIVRSRINGYGSFFIAPDGSKEGWDASDEGDSQRKAFIDWLRESESWVSWALVQYGDDDGESLVADHSDAEESPDA